MTVASSLQCADCCFPGTLIKARERENVRDRKAALNHIAAKKEKNRFWGEETAGFCAAGEKFLDVTRVNGSQK